MRLPWRGKARLIEPRQIIGHEFIELQTGKDILAEIFRARPEDMIQRRPEGEELV